MGEFPFPKNGVWEEKEKERKEKKDLKHKSLLGYLFFDNQFLF